MAPQAHFNYTTMKKNLFNILLALSLPQAVFAAGPASLRDLAVFFMKIMLNITSILFALLGVGMLYGIVMFFANADNEKKREEIKGYLLWGIIGIVVVFGIWGIVSLLRYSVFGTGAVGIPQIAPPV